MTELVTRADLAAVETRFRDALDRQSLRMTVRMGSMVAALIAAAVAVLGS